MEEDQIVLVVQGQQIIVRRSAIALVSKFFKALFSHEFQDSKKRVLHLDPGGQMGLTISAVQVRNSQYNEEVSGQILILQNLADFAQTKQVKMDSESAVQLFIAGLVSNFEVFSQTFHLLADALDVEIAREEAETFLGKRVLKPDKVFRMVGNKISFYQV